MNIFFINRLEKMIQRKHMLLHPFYQAWTHGLLTRPILQIYAKEYYQHVKAFPTYISALHSRCGNPKIRKCLLSNLIDEEAGNPNHPDLWRSFTLALKVDEKELETYNPQTSTLELIDNFRRICTSQPLTVGLAALYSYESQIPEICRTKIDGLKKWYGFVDPISYRYFSVHETVDIEHAHSEKQILTSLVLPEEEQNILSKVEDILNSLNNFLSSIPIGNIAMLKN